MRDRAAAGVRAGALAPDPASARSGDLRRVLLLRLLSTRAEAHGSSPRAGGGPAPLLALLQHLVLGGDGGDDGRRHGAPPLASDAGLDDCLLLQRARRGALPLRRSLPGRLRAQGRAGPRTRAVPLRHLTLSLIHISEPTRL